VNTQQFPRDGRPPPVQRGGGNSTAVYAFLTSPVLAIALLAVVLACCVIGVTVVRGVRAGELIFSTLWFNALLVLLAVSSATAFFSRIWRRKLTLVSAGMILFHLSFVAMLGGIVYNRLFFFTGLLRLTEGETLPNGDPASYDYVQQGRFFSPSRLRGATTLVKMHLNYEVDGGNKRAAYELAVGEEAPRKKSIIYVTEYLDVDGVRYFCSKEGYSVLLVATGKDGAVVGGAHIPLQSYKQPDGSFRYAAGSAAEEMAFAFPPPPDQRLDVGLAFRPSTVKERDGEVTLRVWGPGVLDRFLQDAAAANAHGPAGGKLHAAPASKLAAGTRPHAQEAAPATPALPEPAWKGTVVVGAPFAAGDLTLTAREIRYWVGIDVRYDPGLTMILGSLVAGLCGMVLTFAGRVRQGGARKRNAEVATKSTPAAAAHEEMA
jgi:hypothetical protein